MKKKFYEADIELLRLDEMDVVATSSGGGSSSGDGYQDGGATADMDDDWI